jgi:7-keto-8-aminopelargonate synthetase-like enzyme
LDIIQHSKRESETPFQNKRGPVRHLSTEVRQQELDWRRSQVLELSSKGYTVREIAAKLQVDKSAVGRDMLYLRKQAQQNLEHHIHQVIPEMYQRGITGMQQNLKRALEIGEASSDPKVKLESIRIANDCHRFIMDLCTNASVVNDALKFVTHQKEQIDTLQKLDERINQQQAAEEEEATTNGVF